MKRMTVYYMTLILLIREQPGFRMSQKSAHSNCSTASIATSSGGRTGALLFTYLIFRGQKESERGFFRKWKKYKALESILNAGNFDINLEGLDICGDKDEGFSSEGQKSVVDKPITAVEERHHSDSNCGRLGDMVPRAQKSWLRKWGNDSEWSVPRVYLLSILAAYTGAVGSTRVRMSKPLLLPEPYGGEAGGWAEWVDHFENVATVNKWATGEEKLKWLKSLLGVKQKRPTNVEEAVVATIELESYLGSSGKPLRVSAVSPQEPDPDVRVRRADRAEAVAAVSPLDEPQTVSCLASGYNGWRCYSRDREFHKASDKPYCKILSESRNRAASGKLQSLSGKSLPRHKSATCNGVMVANAVVSPSSNVVPVRILNPRDEMVVLKKGTQIASMELLEQDPVINISTVMKNAEVSLECQNILWDLVSKVGSHISESEREQLYSLLVEFADVFSFSSKDLGRTKELKHHIFTSDAQPVHLSPRRIPQARREELRGLLRDMLESDVIQRLKALDYRKVNEITRKDAYPLPRVDDTLDTLVGSKFFTTLDLASGYWQVEVAPEDQPKTAFTTPEGLYQFKCLHSSEGGGSQAKTKKVYTLQAAVTFLGHIVTDPSKTEAVSKWPIPQNRKERLTEKKRTFRMDHWMPKNAFDELRKRLVSSPVLAYPDYERRFILDTDASDVGIGAVLSQVSDCGSERVIAYASRSLTRPEQRQCGRDEDIESENTVMVGVVSNPFQKYTPAEMRQMQLDDTTIQPVHCAVSCGQPTSPDIVKSWSRGSRLLMQHWTPSAFMMMEPNTTSEYARCLKDALQEAYALVRERCQEAEHKRQKELLKPCVISDDKPENTGSREQEPVGTNLDLVDSDDDDPVQQEEAAVPEIASPPVPPLNEQRRYPVRDRQRTTALMEHMWNTKKKGAV
eukprot:Em0135g2a